MGIETSENSVLAEEPGNVQPELLIEPYDSTDDVGRLKVEEAQTG